MYQICVSGAAKGSTVEEGETLAYELGAAIARAGHSLFTGATVGLPNFAAEGYKNAGGKMSIGISPASSKVEHVMKYRLPTLAYDNIIYSGLHYVGRDMLLITSSDAVVSIGGRLGTLHEFTIAVETDTPIGFLHGAGGIGDEIQPLLDASHPLRRNSVVLFNDSSDKLVAELTKILDKTHAKYKDLYQ